MNLSAWVSLGALVGCAAVASSSCSSPAPPTTSTTSTGSPTTGGGTGSVGGSQSVGGSGGAGAGGAGAGGSAPVGTCGIGLPQPGAGGGTPTNGRVRVVAANLTSGNEQSYDGGHGTRILQGLDADVMLLQEMNFGDNSRAAMDTLVDDICGGECFYMRGPQEQIPNGVLSRLPILECGSWPDPEVSNRTFVWARIDVPGAADLWAVSVHLLSSNPTSRALEATSLLNHLAGIVPDTDWVVVGGDLNTDSRTEAAITTLDSMFATGGPHPADHDGNDMTNAPRSKPYDWVLADSALSAREIAVTIGLSVFPQGAVIDTRVYVPLTEIAPAVFGDSGAPSMQHMAVVKDFQLD